MNRELFYKSIRKSFGKLNKSQVQGYEAMLDVWLPDPDLSDIRHMSYKLATAWHETAYTMQPIVERGSRSYFNKYEPHTKIGKALGNKYLGDGYLFRGRGLVQLTGRENHKKMGKILGLPLEEKPEMLLEMNVSIAVMDEGMHTRKSFRGDFTGKSLENYFNKKISDPVGARRIINGTDKAHKIAGHYYEFMKAFEFANA